MQTRLMTRFSSLLIFLCLLGSLSGCALLRGVGQDTGNGTPSVPMTATPQPTAPASARGSTYAYIAENQLWVALQGSTPRKVTAFANSSTTLNIYWHSPLWSSHARYLAVIVSAQPAGVGGGGCPAPQFGANGALYVLDTVSMRLSKVTVPADSGDAQANSPQNGYWQTYFWQDATHLLAWYNGAAPGVSNSAAGLYSYDLSTHLLTRVVTLADLGVATLFNQDVPKDTPLLLALRYNQGYLYYQEVVQPFTTQSRLLLQRISLLPGTVSTPQLVLTQSSAGWCTSSSSAYIKPGWDIAPGGRNLVAQVPAEGTSSIKEVDLVNGVSTELFAGLPAAASGHDLTLSWSPSGKTIVASESHAFSQDGPFCVQLAQPKKLLSYKPVGAGEVVWRSDSQAFTLQNIDLTMPSATNGPLGPYIYQIDQNTQQAQLLLNGVSGFAWG
ncbi:MAG TPA: hypothetical protein VFN35_29865 [Ktedonobacteraceae bacterium]|nr:hypothetical protein [Ktedonobacteraceae bacterium]